MRDKPQVGQQVTITGLGSWKPQAEIIRILPDGNIVVKLECKTGDAHITLRKDQVVK